MEHCHYCGEYKRVRRIGNNEKIHPFANLCNIYVVGAVFKKKFYTCKECEKALLLKLKIQERKMKDAELSRRKKECKSWIKERDKILNEEKE